MLDEVVDYRKLARYKPENAGLAYGMLFELMNNEELRDIAVKLLNRLLTSKAILEEMLEKGKQEFSVWFCLALLQYLLTEEAKKGSISGGNSGIDQGRG